MDPTKLPEEHSKDPATNQTREAPAPGVPIPRDRYEWLKKKAKIPRHSETQSGQEDPSGKRKK
jgi:hypothetical protein